MIRQTIYKLLIPLAIAASFSLGLWLGYQRCDQIRRWAIAHGWQANLGKHYRCPQPDIVLKNLEQLSPWQDQSLKWNVDSYRWPATTDLQFMQATLDKEFNRLLCYYQWPHPTRNRNWLWLSIQLNPQSNQQVIPVGQHWGNLGSEIVCRAGEPETCPFVLERFHKELNDS